CALVVYAPLAAWLTVASLPFGDQVHYLLAADRLAHGSLDATIDAGMFRSLLGSDPSSADVATRVANAPLGPRTVRGHVLPPRLARRRPSGRGARRRVPRGMDRVPDAPARARDHGRHDRETRLAARRLPSTAAAARDSSVSERARRRPDRDRVSLRIHGTAA